MSTPAAAAPEARIQTYAEFWPFYLGEHRKRATRVMHFIGTSCVIALFISGVVFMRPLNLVFALLPGYGFAWVSHFFIEHNRPATFKYPAWSLISDFKMFFLTLVGKIGAHLDAAGVKH